MNCAAYGPRRVQSPPCGWRATPVPSARVEKEHVARRAGAAVRCCWLCVSFYDAVRRARVQPRRASRPPRKRAAPARRRPPRDGGLQPISSDRTLLLLHARTTTHDPQPRGCQLLPRRCCVRRRRRLLLAADMARPRPERVSTRSRTPARMRGGRRLRSCSAARHLGFSPRQSKQRHLCRPARRQACAERLVTRTRVRNMAIRRTARRCRPSAATTC